MYCKLFVSDKNGDRMDMELFRILCEENDYSAEMVTIAAKEFNYSPVQSYIDLQTMINLEYPGKVIL